MSKLTKAQIQKLATIPEDWALVPFHGDTRPIAPLLRMGMFEERKTDVTPADWGQGTAVRVIKHEWRITPAGRAALANGDEGK